MYENSVHQCQFCPMGFSNPRALERHLWQSHPQLTTLLDPTYIKSLAGTSPSVTDKLKQAVSLRLPIQTPSENSENEESTRSSKLMDKINNLQAMRLDKQVKIEPRSPSTSGKSHDYNENYKTGSNSFIIILISKKKKKNRYSLSFHANPLTRSLGKVKLDSDK